MKKMIIVLLSVVAGISVVTAGGFVVANHSHTVGGKSDVFINGHSGGTDASGCHTNHKTGGYHCHNPK